MVLLRKKERLGIHMENKTVWKKYSTKQNNALEDFSEKYIDFISECKTERECTDYLVSILEDNGFMELSRLLNGNAKLKAGDKVYSVNKNKGILYTVSFNSIM